MAKRRDGEMGFTNSAGAHQQQAGFAARRVISRKSLHDQLCLRQAAIPPGSFRASFPNIGLEIFEVAMLVPAWYARSCQAASGAIGFGAVARYRPGGFWWNGWTAPCSLFALDDALFLDLYSLDESPARAAAQGGIGIEP